MRIYSDEAEKAVNARIDTYLITTPALLLSGGGGAKTTLLPSHPKETKQIGLEIHNS